MSRKRNDPASSHEDSGFFSYPGGGRIFLFSPLRQFAGAKLASQTEYPPSSLGVENTLIRESESVGKRILSERFRRRIAARTSEESILFPIHFGIMNVVFSLEVPHEESDY